MNDSSTVCQEFDPASDGGIFLVPIPGETKDHLIKRYVAASQARREDLRRRTVEYRASQARKAL